MKGLLSKIKGKLATFDSMLLFEVLLISVMGLVAVYSATYSFGSLTSILVQTGAFAIGVIIMMTLSRFDYEQFNLLTLPIFGASVFLLVLVLLIGTGADEVGAKSWIRFGPIGIQPAEIAKVGFIITFSYHLKKKEKSLNTFKTLVGLLVHVGIFLALIMLQPDAGSAMVFCFIFAVLLFMAGLSWKIVVPVIAAGTMSIPFIYKFLLSPYQQYRIQVFLNPELDPLGKGYNVIQSKIAVGSGGLLGKGYLQGTQNQLGFLPAKHTDFIFSTFAEEFGFVGAILVVTLLVLIIIRCFVISAKSRNSFGKYIAAGVGAMLLFHTLENVGMCIGLMPVTGIPLPFFSYGGTSMLTNLTAIGLVLSVSRRNKMLIR
ncbi:MAG: rod shape-determining protein RodA [Clostridia bacterium]|nr:rod shape-determining protein RodA [Clostridia bacterium]